MGAHHHHHGHHHHAAGANGDKRMFAAVAVNVVLTLAQIIGGLASGSLSLVADALHNFSDAASLYIAFAARRIARRPADAAMTFGYARAEIVAALINYTTLIVVGLYLVYEAIMRFWAPEPITGWIVVIVASVALMIDIVTALLTWRMAKTSMNVRAAFLHNIADALGSVGVIVAGVLVIAFGWTWVDPLVTLLIAAYILCHGFAEIGGSVRMLMLGSPDGLDVDALIGALRGVEGVEDVHHIHVWAMDETHNALEAHLVIASAPETARFSADAQAVKGRVRTLAQTRFGIGHCTLEIEGAGERCSGHSRLIGHGAESQCGTGGHGHDHGGDGMAHRGHAH